MKQRFGNFPNITMLGEGGWYHVSILVTMSPSYSFQRTVPLPYVISLVYTITFGLLVMISK